MKNLEDIRRRYLKDDIPIRLGGLAANLARIASVSKNPDNWKIVDSLMEESKYFIEWTARETQFETMVFLTEVQQQLAFWHRLWPQIHTNSIECETIQNYARKWSRELLEISEISRTK